MKATLYILLTICTLAIQAQSINDYHSDLETNSDLALLESDLEFTNIEIEQLQQVFASENEKSGFFDDLLKSFTDKIKEYAQKATEKLKAELQKLIENFVSKLLWLSEFALNGLETRINDAKSHLITSEDNNAVECYDKYRPALDAVYKEAKGAVQNCVINALGEVREVGKQVQKSIDKILEEVFVLEIILKKCIKPIRPIYTVKCLLENSKTITKTVKGIVSNAYKALKNAATDLTRITKEATECVKKNVEIAEEKLKKVLDDIRECLDEGVPTTTPEPETTTQKPTTTTPEPSTTTTPKPSTTTTPKPTTTTPKPTTTTTTTPKPTTTTPKSTTTTTRKSTTTTTTKKPTTESSGELNPPDYPDISNKE